MDLNIDLEKIRQSRKITFTSKDLVAFGLFKSVRDINNARCHARPCPPGEIKSIGSYNQYTYNKYELIKWIEKQRKEALKPKKKTPFGGNVVYKRRISEEEEMSEFLFETSPTTYGLSNDDDDYSHHERRLAMQSGLNSIRRKKDTR